MRKALRSEKFAQRIRRINRAIDQDVRDMDILGGKFCVKALTEHAPSAHCSGVAMLPGIAAHRGCRGRNQQRATAPLHHLREQLLRHPEHAEIADPPAQFKGLERRVCQRSVTDLRAEIIDQDVDRADIRFDIFDQFLDRPLIHGVEQMARCLATRRLDLGDHPVESVQIAAATKRSVIAIPSKSLCDMTANTRAGSDYHANIGHKSGPTLIISETG